MTFSPNTPRFIHFIRKNYEFIISVGIYLFMIGLILIAL